MSDDSLLKACLLWDVPALLASGAPEARLFFDAMSRYPLTTAEQAAPDRTLTRAGLAVAAYTAGDFEQAQKLGAELSSDPNALARFIGLNLIAWLEPSVSLELLQAAEQIASAEKGQFRARLLTKVFTLYVDAGQLEEAVPIWRSALRAARQGSSLRRQLVFLGLNRFRAEITITESDWRGPTPPDPLVDYPWIVSRSEEGLHKTVVESTTASSASPWSITLRFGRGSLDDLLAADMQTTWTGALWLRNGIRLSLAAVLLNGSASSPPEFAEALALWIQNGGKAVPAVLERTERHFDESSADQIVAQLEASRVGWEQSSIVEAYAGLWDEVGESVIRRWIEEVPVVSSDHPTWTLARQLWVALVLRAPTEWQDALDALDRDQQVSLLDAVTPDVAARLPTKARRLLSMLIREEAAPRLTQEADVALLFAALLESTPAASKSEWTVFDEAGPSVVAALAPRYGSNLGRKTLQGAAIQLVEEVRREAEGAKAGTRGFGGIPPAIRLAQIARAQRVPGAEVALVDVSTDPEAPADIRLDGLRGLHYLTFERPLSPKARSRVLSMPLEGRPSFFERATPELIDCLRVATLMGRVVPSQELVGRTLSFARSTDPRVRQIALEAIQKTKSPGSSLVVSLLLTGLSDPSPDVVIRALVATRQLVRIEPSLQSALEDRVIAVFEQSPRTVRVQAVLAASRLTRRGLGSNRLSGVVSRGASDRSWLVRDAANQGASETEADSPTSDP